MGIDIASAIDIEYDIAASVLIGIDMESEGVSENRQAGVIATASVWQARQPVYQRSAQRWQHYAGYLETAARRLREGGVVV